MNRFFTQVAGKKIHYRTIGNGPYLILLHPSPRTSELLEPLMHTLANNFTCIAPDLAGYGLSERLDEAITNITVYIPWLHQFIQHFTTEPIYIYGTATGAQLAIAYSLQYTNVIEQLFLDNCAHFTNEERAEILENYFIDLTPQQDGSHLTILWQHIIDSCLYFPWYKKELRYKINDKLPPPSVLQKIANDYLVAGIHYADAYKAAFNNEDVKYIQQLTVNTTIFKWLGSPLLPYLIRITEQNLPTNVTIIETPKDITLRYEAMQQHFAKRLIILNNE